MQLIFVKSIHLTVAFAWLLLLGNSTCFAQENFEDLEAKAVQSAVAKVAPSVVKIQAFGGLEKVGQITIGSGPTTGLVVGEDGYVVSSAFNFVQQPADILVWHPTVGKSFPAKVVARDHNRMLVLLKVNTKEKFVVPPMVERSKMAVGDYAIAVGRTFDGNQPNISVGIVSALNRVWGKAIQTDAKISPSNYGGPLIDIQGRVLGVLAPLSPQDQGEVAGAEWYDSGIGFAVPLAEWMPRLETLKKGTDIHSGIAGISLKGTDIYANAAEIAACQANSPAAKAGLKVGDTIVEIDGSPVVRQAQMKHLLGPRYAGDKLKFVVLRGKDRVEAMVELADKLQPYEHPFLGILPLRLADRSQDGVTVRYIYPGSPAEKAGLKIADRIVKLDGKPIRDAAGMQEMVSAIDLQAKPKLEVVRGGQTLSLDISLASLPTAIPDVLPPGNQGAEVPAGPRAIAGIVRIKLPEESTECIAYVPDSYNPVIPAGMLIWLHEPGGYDKDKIVARFKDACERQGIVLLAPKASKATGWERTELDFIRKCVDESLRMMNIDKTRIAIGGYQSGAAQAILAAYQFRDSIRGLAAIEAGPPRGVKPPENDPVHRLAIFSAVSEKTKGAEMVEPALKFLETMKFPITRRALGATARMLNETEIAELLRWLDTLDRI